MFPVDIRCTITFLLGREDLPQPARHYIMVKAARVFQARQQGEGAEDKFTEGQEFDPMLALQQHEAETGDYNVLRDNESCASVIRGFQDYYLSS